MFRVPEGFLVPEPAQHEHFAWTNRPELLTALGIVEQLEFGLTSTGKTQFALGRRPLCIRAGLMRIRHD